MTNPTRTGAHGVSSTGTSSAGGGGAFGSQPTDYRALSLQSAVAILRGRSPAPEASDVIAMAEEFHTFLKKGSGAGFGSDRGF